VRTLLVRASGSIEEMASGEFGFNPRFGDLETYVRSFDVAALSAPRKP
jgi:hypothetical protein